MIGRCRDAYVGKVIFVFYDADFCLHRVLKVCMVIGLVRERLAFNGFGERGLSVLY